MNKQNRREKRIQAKVIVNHLYYCETCLNFSIIGLTKISSTKWETYLQAQVYSRMRLIQVRKAWVEKILIDSCKI